MMDVDTWDLAADLAVVESLAGANPYYQMWRRVYNDEPYSWRERINQKVSSHTSTRVSVRAGAVRRYAWAVPSPEIIAVIRDVAPSIVEIGAGTGYWAKMLNDVGVDVVAFDENPPTVGSDANSWHSNTEAWFDVRPSNAEKAAEYPERTLLLVWPPCGESMALTALRAFASAGGRRVIYVGEGMDGCTGDDQFHEDLENWWIEVGSMVVPQWEGLHDIARFYGHRPPLALPSRGSS